MKNKEHVRLYFSNPAPICYPTTLFRVSDIVETVSTKSQNVTMSTDTKLGRGVRITNSLRS